MSIDGRGDVACRVLLRAPDESSSAYRDRIASTAPESIGRALLSEDTQCANGLAGNIGSMQGAVADIDKVCGSAGAPEAAECRAGFESALCGEELVAPTNAAKRGFVAARITATSSVHSALRMPGVADTLY